MLLLTVIILNNIVSSSFFAGFRNSIENQVNELKNQIESRCSVQWIRPPWSWSQSDQKWIPLGPINKKAGHKKFWYHNINSTVSNEWQDIYSLGYISFSLPVTVRKLKKKEIFNCWLFLNNCYQIFYIFLYLLYSLNVSGCFKQLFF